MALLSQKRGGSPWPVGPALGIWSHRGRKPYPPVGQAEGSQGQRLGQQLPHGAEYARLASLEGAVWLSAERTVGGFPPLTPQFPGHEAHCVVNKGKWPHPRT